MFLTDTETSGKVEAIIEHVLSTDYKIIKKSKRFPGFNWGREKKNEVLKIRLKNGNEILGLMSMIDFKKEMWIKINLLQISKENVGRGKKYDHIAGCLIAYAYRLSFQRGYGGAVALEPKTDLIKHYTGKYGMQNAGLHWYTQLKNSDRLIREYLT